MPVDPGNLLLIGNAGGVPVLGAPGCARSPVENGFDWVLMRLLAGLKVTRAELTGMGVGGLLMEIVTRPQPRKPAGPEGNRNVAAVILAAGRSTRMGGPNKLLAELGGKKLVRIVTEQALASKASSVIVVTGHQAEEVEKALAGLKVKFVRNPDFAAGLASSVKAGIAAVPADADGAVVCLGDMPLIDARSDRPADRGVRARPRPFDRGAGQRQPARQSGAVVAAVLQRIDDARRRYRRPPSDRQAQRGGGGSRRSRATARFSISTRPQALERAARQGAQAPAASDLS